MTNKKTKATKATKATFNLKRAVATFTRAATANGKTQVSAKAAKTALRNGAAILCKTEQGRKDVKAQNDAAKGAGLASLVSECAFYYALPVSDRGDQGNKDIAAHIKAIYADDKNKGARLRTNFTAAYKWMELCKDVPLSLCNNLGALYSEDSIRDNADRKATLMDLWSTHCDDKDAAQAERANAASANVASGTVLQSIETLSDTALLALQDAVQAEIERRTSAQLAA